MRLMNARTYVLEEFSGDDIPPYAILSHTWVSNEITFNDIYPDRYKAGASVKIDGCCRIALQRLLDYVWVDTCCFDKSSSAELSEAINSMWSWYEMADQCYVYLSDVEIDSDMQESDLTALTRSRWFTRGWTLQELIAPWEVYFFDGAWKFLGQKTGSGATDHFVQKLAQITRIPVQVFQEGGQISQYSIAQRMCWAAGRTTTRIEDIAYSLLGLFNVNMTMLYGEGGRAFKRLQEEIIKTSTDESVFAWGFAPESNNFRHTSASFLASFPADFVNCSDVVPFTPVGTQASHYALTNKGLQIELSICNSIALEGATFGRLNCLSTKLYVGTNLVIPLNRSKDDGRVYCPSGAPLSMPSNVFEAEGISKSLIYLTTKGLPYTPDKFWALGIELPQMLHHVSEYYPIEHAVMSNILIPIEPFNTERRKYLRCDCIPGSFPFVVETVYRVYGDFDIDIRCRAAAIEKDKSLAELLIRNSHLNGALDWQNQLQVGKSKVSFQGGLVSPRRWQLCISLE